MHLLLATSMSISRISARGSIFEHSDSSENLPCSNSNPESSVASWNGLQIIECLFESLLVRIACGKVEPDTTDCDFDLRADFQQLQSNRRALCVFQFRAFQSQTSQGVHQHVGDRRAI